MKPLLALLVIAGTFAMSMVYADYHAFEDVFSASHDARDRVSNADVAYYLQLYFGPWPNPEGSIVSAAKQYRVLVPFLARWVPDLPLRFFSPGRSALRPEQSAAMKFAAVNGLFLLGTGIGLYHLIRGFGLPIRDSLIGALLFFGLKQVVWIAGLPTVESGYWFFLLLGALMVQREKAVLLAMSALAGVFAKELVFMVLALVLLSPIPMLRRMRLLFAFLPAPLIYFAVRLWLFPVYNDRYFAGHYLESLGTAVRLVLTLNGLVQLFSAFWFLWLPALTALWSPDLPLLLRRWSWFIPIILLGTIGFGEANLGTKMVGAFPVVLPLAAWKLAEWLQDDDRAGIGC